MAKEELVLSPCFADCQNIGDSIKFSLGSEIFEIKAEPSTDTRYEITLLKQVNEDNNIVLFSTSFDLTPLEYNAAIASSLNDSEIFRDNIDGLMSQRVARDLFTYMLVSVSVKDFNERMKDRYIEEWKDYLFFLIHERMEGRSISLYQSLVL